MYDDILGPEEEKKDNKPKNKVNLLDEICYDCGNTFEECDCEEGFSVEDLYLDEEESKLTVDSNDCDNDCDACSECEEDPWDIGELEASQDIGCLKLSNDIDINCNDCQGKSGLGCDGRCLEPSNDLGRNCDENCKTCEMYDCLIGDECLYE